MPAQEQITKCPDIFEAWTPDEIAECVEQLPDNTITELWALVEKYAHIPRPHPGEGAYPGTGLIEFWSQLSPTTQDILIKAAAIMEAA